MLAGAEPPTGPPMVKGKGQMEGSPWSSRYETGLTTCIKKSQDARCKWEEWTSVVKKAKVLRRP
jgi:hypothetical protein